MPRLRARAADEKGTESVWEGTPLYEVLKAAGIKFGAALRGPGMANYLLIEAADGYRVAFALAELDPAFSDRVFLLADRRNGKPMEQKEGPLRIVVPGAPGHRDVNWTHRSYFEPYRERSVRTCHARVALTPPGLLKRRE